MVKRKVFIWLFCLFFAIMSVVNVFVNPPDYSESENRYLASFPKFSFKELFWGDYTTQLDDYVRDHFFGRDFWVALKAGSEIALQKKENNDVVLGKDGYLLGAVEPVNVEQYKTNYLSVQTFITEMEEAGKNAFVAIVPDAIAVLQDKLPSQYPISEFIETIEGLENDASLHPIPLLQTLCNHQDEYLYYRTDHHWTSLGAYYAYQEICLALGVQPRSIEAFEQTVVTESFFGTMYSKSGVRWADPDAILLLEIPENQYVVSFDGQSKTYNSMFFTEHLEKKDKYSVFLDGNHALTKIVNQNGNGKKILFVKDSFTHSLAPLFAADYSEVHMLDLRYYKGSVSDYMHQNRLDDVVVIYGASNFLSDANLAYIR